MNPQTDYRKAIVEYVRLNAKPPDKFSHQPRLYRVASQLAAGQQHDDDVLFAAAWLHDIGVFIGHRPEDPAALAVWDCVSYALAKAPVLLEAFGFPKAKIPAVVEVIRTHQPSSAPTSFEGVLLRDADLLEQLGAIGIMRTISKVGRDTRFVVFSDPIWALKKNVDELPGKLNLDASRELAEPKIRILREFLDAAEAEAQEIPW